MKKIFILTGEASGDKLASTVIEKIQKGNNDIKFLSVGGSNLANLGINSIFLNSSKDLPDGRISLLSDKIFIIKLLSKVNLIYLYLMHY